MRARRSAILGWVVVLGYVCLLVVTSIGALGPSTLDRAAVADDALSGRFAAAWRRSRETTYVAEGVYQRHSDVTGATIGSEDVVAQRPPRRLHRQLGGVEGRFDDRLVVCPAPPTGEEDEAEPCRLGPPGGLTYVQSVDQEVAGVRSLTAGRDPLYRVRATEPGCFSLRLRRPDPRAPFGARAEFCFDNATGAVRRSEVSHPGGITEGVAVTSIRATVADTDLVP